MKSLIFVLVALSSNAFADQAATITCKGTNVILTTRSPYLGENSAAEQTLYVLKAVDNKRETVSTAYFLDVDIDGDVDKYGLVWTVGKNEKGGSFTLRHTFWEDVGDGTIINEKSIGVLTYSFGNFQGTDERVKCVRK